VCGFAETERNKDISTQLIFFDAKFRGSNGDTDFKAGALQKAYKKSVYE
jgi:hypothetical protein